MSQFDLADEQRPIQEMARQSTADAITSQAGEWEEKHIFPRDTIREATVKEKYLPSMIAMERTGKMRSSSRTMG